MLPPSNKKPVVLVIMDGWGLDENERKLKEGGISVEEYKRLQEATKGNAIAQAKTPVFDKLWKEYPHTTLGASSEEAGLPPEQMGNSEVGHLNIGSGRIPPVPGLKSINEAIEDGTFYNNSELNKYIDTLKETGGTCHLTGLLSTGGVHSHQDHIAALASYIRSKGVEVKIHAITDGRDTNPNLETTLDSIARFKAKVKELSPDMSEEQINGMFATVGGRYFAMDRDNNWDRIEAAYETMAGAKGERFATIEDAIRASYEKGVSAEFILPAVIGDYQGMDKGEEKPKDCLMVANYRGDRAEQISKAFAKEGFSSFERNPPVHLAATLGMCQYSGELPNMSVMFAPPEIENTLAQVISNNGLNQLHTAETEKYAHVTFFFNGGVREPVPGETHTLVDSPKVQSYDQAPDMSAEAVKNKVLEALDSPNPPHFIVANFANPDMVGHTGNLPATVQAVETTDRCVGEIFDAVNKKDGIMLLTADHGNADSVLDKKGKKDTKHTKNRVPLIMAGKGLENFILQPLEFIQNALDSVKQEYDKDKNPINKVNCVLANIAPTILRFMGLEIPKEMTHPPLQDFTRSKAQKMEMAVGIT